MCSCGGQPDHSKYNTLKQCTDDIPSQIYELSRHKNYYSPGKIYQYRRIGNKSHSRMLTRFSPGVLVGKT